MPRIPTTIAQGPLGRTATGASSQARGPSLTREHFADRQSNAVQEAARAANAPANACPFLNGNMLAGVAFTNATTKTLQHQLGRPYVGFIVMNQRPPFGAGTSLDAWDPLTQDSRLRALQIQLTPHATFTADVWVY